ncbi:MAG: hypothetical protein HQL12_08235 [Candidatus Omnitrophica bacterium]|nr:hypothetical protein [Candidatus Omnitrophota bacterium]
MPTLQQIPLEHIESIIYWLELAEKVLKDHSPRDYHPPSRPNAISVGVRQDPLRFHLTILDSFDNWYAGYVFQRDTSLNDLSPLNLEKIYNLITDINDQLQMNPSEKVTIKIDSLNIDKFPLMSSHIIGNSRIMANFRKDALDFLERELVISYAKIVPELDTIAIIVNIEEFTDFKKEVAIAYKTRSQRTDLLETKNLSNDPPTKFSQSFKPTKWENITLTFKDSNNVEIKIGTEKYVAHYKEMGFEDKRTLSPNAQWSLLEYLSKESGQISWDSPQANDTIKKKKQRLSETLQKYFQINEDAFFPYKSEGAYTCRIQFNS